MLSEKLKRIARTKVSHGLATLDAFAVHAPPKPDWFDAKITPFAQLTPRKWGKDYFINALDQKEFDDWLKDGSWDLDDPKFAAAKEGDRQWRQWRDEYEAQRNIDELTMWAYAWAEAMLRRSVEVLKKEVSDNRAGDDK